MRYTFYTAVVPDTYDSYYPCYSWGVSIEFVYTTKTNSKVYTPSTQITKEAFDGGVYRLQSTYMDVE